MEKWFRAMVIAMGMALAGPASAGWDSSHGSNFSGTWTTAWQSSTGSYNSPLTLTGNSGTGALSGTYNDGTVFGTVDRHYNGGGVADGYIFDGSWKRTSGASGGACAYGRFHLVLLDPSPGSEPADLTFSGKWSYCDVDPKSDANPNLWTGEQSEGVALNGKLLPVPLYSQLTNMWCWAASSQMVVGYLYPSVKIPQGDQANYNTGRTDCMNDPTPGPYPPDYKDPRCVQGGWDEFAHYGVSATHDDETFSSKPNPDVHPTDPTKTVGYVTGTGKEGMSWDTLKGHINAGQPVMYAWAWRMHPDVDGDRYVSGGHMMVARGWSTVGGVNYVYINNPWVPQEGAEEIITYDDWIGGLDQDHVHWRDYHDFKGPIDVSKLPFVGPLFNLRIDPARLAALRQLRPPIPDPDPGPLAALQSVRDLEGVRAELGRAAPTLRLLALAEGHLRALGLANAAEAERATIGQGVSEYTLTPGALSSYRPGVRAETLLARPSSVLAPVIVDGRVRSAVRVHAGAGPARVSSFGNAGLIARIDRIAPLSTGKTAAAVRVPALGLYFVARQGRAGLELAPVFSTPQLGLKEGAFEPASAVFARLSGFAGSVNNLPAGGG